MSTSKLALVLAVAIPLTAVADNKTDAQEHMKKAGTAYKEKRWQEALDELNKAYALDPNPKLHFSIGQIYIKMGRCPDAIIAYEQFLASKPSYDDAQVAREAIAACKAAATVAPDPGPDEKPPDPPPIEPTPPPQPPPVEETPRVLTPPAPVDHGGGRWYQDKFGVAMVGGGSLLVVTSVVLYMQARGQASDAEDAATYGEQADLFDSARSKRTLSVVIGLVGVAAAGVGGYHYMKKSKSEDHRGLVIAPTRDGGFVSWTSGF
jgi:tetratricopeptide (TPR) repeat protein